VSDKQRDNARTAIAQWRDKLVNLTGTNRLLRFRITKTSTLAVTEPALPGLLTRLGQGQEWTFVPLRVRAVADDTDGESGQEVIDLDLSVESARARVASDPKTFGVNHDPTRTQTILRTLMTNTNRTFLDTGMWALYLAVGTLTWNEPDDPETLYTSPLVLIPAALKSPGPRTPPTLTLTEDDPLINPALQLKLATQDVVLPNPDELALDGIVEYLNKVSAAVRSHKDWSVGTEAYLTYLTFHKEAMYRDLDENLELILESELVLALANAGAQDGPIDFGFDPTPESRIDEVDPPERAVHVLDADASQRAAIVAASQGKSFVLDGPPGTGKSQTIANIIGALVSQGKSVLFVSEKIAALEVVRNRLDAVGLGTYVLELHSDKTTRKHVAEELSRTLLTQPRVSDRIKKVEREEAERLRRELTEYAAAMNKVRDPLGLSLHHVLGLVSQLEYLPQTKTCSGNLANLTPFELAEIRTLAQQLGRCWRAQVQGDLFLWNGILDQTPILAELNEARENLGQLLATLAPYGDVLSLLGWSRLSDSLPLADLISRWHERPAKTHADWLRAVDIDHVSEQVHTASDLVTSARAAISAAAAVTGARWAELPASEAPLPLDAALDEASKLAWPLTHAAQANEAELHEAASDLRAMSEALKQLRSTSTDLAQRLGLVPPGGFDDLRGVLGIEELSREAHRPERSWFKTQVDDSVAIGIGALEQANANVVATREAAEPFFRATVLDVDPEGLMTRFANVHRGMRKLGGAYRTDLRVVAEASTPGQRAKDNIAHLGLAVEWLKATQARVEAEERYANTVGSRYQQEATDWSDLRASLDNARTIASEARTQTLETLLDSISYGTAPDPALRERRQEITLLLDRLQAALRNPPLRSHSIEPGTASFEELGFWIDQAQEAVNGLIQPLVVATTVLGGTPTVGAAQKAWNLAASAHDTIAELEDASDVLTATLGDSFAGLSTDLDELERALIWTIDVRNLIHEPGKRHPSNLSDELIEALEDTYQPDSVRSAWERWVLARADLVGKFSEERSADLTDTLDHPNEALGLIQDLLHDPAGQTVWFGGQEARELLDAYGLTRVITHMTELSVSGDEVAGILERETLRRWADIPLQKESALRRILSSDRDEIVSKFRDLDQRLVLTAVGEIIHQANKTRPTSIMGQGGTLVAEGQKKTRHLPIRHLIDRTRDVTQKIKPVFMMSPLSVSQFLTPDLKFDTVIFDEASQVMPEDAVNCIYRGNQLIIAGDDKQLPPTNFFSLADAEDGEFDEEETDAQAFESILGIAKGSGALTSLTLQWHYRSRHENLIAFSNRKFYGGGLITFPSSEADGPHVGVELFHVPNGVYDRAGARHNLAEARFVAERVEHHFDHRPNRTLGVVAFSTAQADAIEAAVDELRDRRPDLADALLGTSRLDGFFIKNLESVQGDERDVMIFSIGYGPDAAGKFTMNFGPINKEGGWRRLNVAVTRARYRNEIVSSFHPGEMQAGGTGSVATLRTYLDFASRGIVALEAPSEDSLGDAESPFEESVVDWLRGQGHDVVTQVGASGYRIDMAVRDPRYPGRYLLGIECDGKAYHSSTTARDRDRLRESVLKALGWRLHRIWGTAWYRHRQDEQRRLLAAIEDAMRARIDGVLAAPEESVDARTEVSLVAFEPDSTASWVEEYRMSTPSRPPRSVDPASPSSVPHLRRTVEEIVTVESPVHMDLVDDRIRDTWGIGRITHRVRPNIDEAIATSSEVQRDGDFLYVGDLDGSVPTRRHDRSVKRDIEHVHHREIEDAIYRIVLEAGAISMDQLLTVCSRYLGFNRLGSDVRSALEGAVRLLQDLEWLTASDDERIRIAVLDEE
jgi:very-short-patch-repair endonuclease